MSNNNNWNNYNYNSKDIFSPKRISYLHYILIFIGILLLLQGLLTRFLGSWSILNIAIKYFDEVFPIAIFGLILITRLLYKDKIIRTNIDLLLVFFILTAVISSIMAKVPGFIFISQLILYIKGFLVFYIFANISINIRILNIYIKAFFYAGVFIFLLGLVDLIAPLQFRSIIGNTTQIDYRNNIPSVISIFVHPVIFGWFMSFLSLYCFAFFLTYRRMSYFVMGLTFLTGCFLSMRIKAIAGIIIGLAIGLLFLPIKKRLKALIIFLPIVVISAFLLWPSINELFRSRLAIHLTEDASLNVARNVLYEKSIVIAKDYFPLGAGLGRYGSWLSHMYYSPIYIKYGLFKVWGISVEKSNFITDTFWPMVLGEVGFIGLILYVIIVLVFLISLYRLIKLSKNKFFKAFLIGTYMMLIEALVESIANPIFTGPPAVFFILGAIGICYSFYNTNNKQVNYLNENEYDEYDK